MTTVFVHIEPLEDESSFRDQGPDGPSSRDASGNVGADDRGDARSVYGLSSGYCTDVRWTGTDG